MAGNRRKRTEGQSAGKRLNVVMKEESIRRLMIHVVMAGRNPGDILSDLIDTHLKDFAIPATLVNRGKSRDRTAGASPAIESVADLAA